MKTAIIFLFLGYFSVPFILYLFPQMLGFIIFEHKMRYPFFVDLSKPEALINHTINFYLSPEPDISVGVWHTLPASQWDEAVGKSHEWYQQTLGDDNPVFIYLHGNSGTRAMDYRVDLMKVLSAAGYHVLSLEYRGFGDSTGNPSEAGMTADAMHLYHWAKKRSGRSLMCLWGHSLGTGAATNTAVALQKEGSPVDAVILEAPYTRIKDLLARHQLTKIYMIIPGFANFLWGILAENEIVFPNDDNVKVLESSLLILHAEDDDVVPLQMGEKLYQLSLEAKKQHDRDVQVEMVSYPAHLGYEHNHIDMDPDLPNVIRKFLQNVRK